MIYIPFALFGNDMEVSCFCLLLAIFISNFCNLFTYLKVFYTDDDVIKWKDFPCYWPFVWGIHRSVNSPHTGPVTRSFAALFDLHLNIRMSKLSWGRLVIWDAIACIMTSLQCGNCIMALISLMPPCHGNGFRVTGPSWGQSTCHRWIALTKSQ